MSIRDFKLPDLGEGLEEGDIVAWRVEVGETIELNQTVAEIETAKAVVEVPSPFAGKVTERIGEEGETIAVGEVFLRIDTDVAGGAVAAAGQPGDAAAGTPEGELVPDGDAVDAPAPGGSVLDADEEPQPLVGYGQRDPGGRRRRRSGPSPVETLVGAQRVLAKPPVRKLAKDLGVELAAIAPGSGEDGIITRDDVRAAADGGSTTPTATPAPAATPTDAPTAATAPAREPARASAPAASDPSDLRLGFRGRRPGEVEKVAGIRKRIIEKMETSRRTIPHALCATDADVTALWELREDLTAQARSQGYDVRITPYTLVMRATVLALRRFPTLNAVYDERAGEIRLLEHINLGVAVDTDRGLLVANVKDAHAKSLLEISSEAAALAQRCRDGSASPADLTGGTFTTDNYGYFGNDDGNPIINAPEVGILGISAMKPRPWVHQDAVVPRRVCRFQLAFDHRVCDGGEAGRFVTYVAELCEQPSRLLLHV